MKTAYGPNDPEFVVATEQLFVETSGPQRICPSLRQTIHVPLPLIMADDAQLRDNCARIMASAAGNLMESAVLVRDALRRQLAEQQAAQVPLPLDPTPGNES
jgi:hypothetical protein